MLTDDRFARVRALNDVAGQRGQSLARLALAWALRDPRMTSLVIGASSVAQLDDNVDALDHLDLTDDELAQIDRQQRAPMSTSGPAPALVHRMTRPNDVVVFSCGRT